MGGAIEGQADVSSITRQGHGDRTVDVLDCRVIVVVWIQDLAIGCCDFVLNCGKAEVVECVHLTAKHWNVYIFCGRRPDSLACLIKDCGYDGLCVGLASDSTCACRSGECYSIPSDLHHARGVRR